ncbi:MAG: PilZ domain-containing protein [Spirochaetes bacterium]|nr:PilZ domain-containing protein [Spirochaetota bacterium]
MSIITSQQITRYYETFKSIDVTFTREVIKSTGLLPPHVFLKCLGDQWPCVVYSTSFEMAKVIASTRTGILERFKKSNNITNLRFCFRLPDKEEPLSFFISAKVAGYAPYQGGQDLAFLTLQYTQQPPDDLIEILGKLLEANMNSKRRREERILVTADSLRKLRIVSKESFIYIQGVPRRCILRDLSFSGSKIILVGIAKFLSTKECMLRIELDDPRETVDIKGTILRSEDVEGRKDLAALAIRFDETQLPMAYKMHINDFLIKVKILVQDGDKKDSPPPNPNEPRPQGPGQSAAPSRS